MEIKEVVILGFNKVCKRIVYQETLCFNTKPIKVLVRFVSPSRSLFISSYPNHAIPNSNPICKQ